MSGSFQLQILLSMLHGSEKMMPLHFYQHIVVVRQHWPAAASPHLCRHPHAIDTGYKQCPGLLTQIIPHNLKWLSTGN